VDPVRPPAEEKKIPTTGVIFVHGIGSQQPGETLLQWSAPLIEVLTAWKSWAAPGSAIRDPVRTAKIDFDGRDPRIVLDIPAATIGQTNFARNRWILTEAWWAAKVAPPSLSTMTSWLGPQGGIGRIVDAIIGNTSGEAGLISRFRFFVTPFVAVLAGLVLTIYALLRGISLLIPIDAVRNAAILQTFDNSLTGWFGDVRVLVYDPAQSSNIRANLADAIRRFREVDKVDHVVVMAHSGGVMVSYLTLVDPAFADAKVDKLITFGEGFNLAMVLTSDKTGMYERLRIDVTADGQRPTLLWRDFYGSHDPAPAGKVLETELGPIDPTTSQPVGAVRTGNIKSRQVWNRRSLLDDHGSYFDNDEEFTLAVLREIDRPTGWGETPPDRFPDQPVSRFYPTPTPSDDFTQPPIDLRERRHRERVAILALMRQLAISAAIGSITVVLADSKRLSDLGRSLGDILGGIPVVHDVGAGLVRFMEDLRIPEIALTNPPFGIAPFMLQPAVVIDALGLATLQAIVLVSVAQLIVAPVRADHAWASSNPRRAAFALTEWAVAILLVAALVFLAIAPGHPELLGAGWQEWLPGVALTLATLGIGWLGTQAARRVPGFIRLYAAGTIVVFLAAMASAVLVIFRRPNLEHGELGYIVIWAAFIVLYRIGLDRWTQWDRIERRAAYEAAPDVLRSRVPVQISIAGFVAAGFGLIAWIVPGYSEVTVVTMIVAVILVGVAIVAGWVLWHGGSSPVTSLPPVDSGRGKV
jgi:hypothetical protein